MRNLDPRVDGYIQRSADFAKPILNHIRKLVHKACPEVEETIKWGMPFFLHHGLLCHMASFKQHCAFGLRKGSSILKGKAATKVDEAMGHFGRITALEDLPTNRVILNYLKRAIQLNAKNAMKPRGRKMLKKSASELPLPEDLLAALKKNRKAALAFDKFSPSHRKEYIQWIAQAKREETRSRRVKTAIEWIGTGKSRNWKYEK